MLYLLLKTIHIAAVVLFVGNITTGVLWKVNADRSGDPRLMAHALNGLIRADRWFTQPGSTLILLTGVALAWIGGYSFFGTFWIWMGLALFAVSGIVFKVWIEPAQKRLLAVAQAENFDSAEYARVSRTWTIAGVIATVAPYIALALMVFKPA
ncbi:MAG TPA: DUF2269 family protein [Gammaproteobacteria bacterium]